MTKIILTVTVKSVLYGTRLASTRLLLTLADVYRTLQGLKSKINHRREKIEEGQVSVFVVKTWSQFIVWDVCLYNGRWYDNRKTTFVTFIVVWCIILLWGSVQCVWEHWRFKLPKVISQTLCYCIEANLNLYLQDKKK